MITMITLMLDKHTLVKTSFSTYGSIPQVPERSTPYQISSPGGFAPPGKVPPPTAA
jgi:hypothetical protein